MAISIHPVAENTDIQLTLTIEGNEINIILPIRYKKIDPSYGEIYQPVRIVPAATVTAVDEVVVLNEQGKANVQVKVRSHVKRFVGWVNYEVNGEVQKVHVELDSMQEKTVSLPVEIKRKNQLDMQGGNEAGIAGVREPGQNNPVGLKGLWFHQFSHKEIDYPHIRRQDQFYPASVKLVQMKLKRNLTHIAYIPGAGG